MKAYERFLKYVTVWTTSDGNCETVPSADREFDFVRRLAEYAYTLDGDKEGQIQFKLMNVDCSSSLSC